MKHVQQSIHLIRYMLGFVWKADKAVFIWALGNALWLIVPTLFHTMIYKLLIDAIVLSQPFIYVVMIAVTYALVRWIGRFWDRILQMRYTRLSLRVKKYSNIILLQKCSSLDMECYDDPTFYDKLSRAFGQANDRAMQVFYQIMRLITNIFSFIVGITVVTMIDPVMIVVAGVSGVIGFLLDISFLKVRFKAEEEMIFINRVVEYFQALMSSRQTISDVKQYNRLAELIICKYKKAADEQLSQSMHLEKRGFRYNVKVDALAVGAFTLFPYVYLAVQCYRAVISVADIATMVNAFHLITDGLSDISREVSNLKASCLYIEQLKDILEYQPKIEMQTGLEPETLDTVVFEDVSFRYPHSDTYVLRHVNITIRKGDKLAIVGMNGAGKTTLVKLLLRYYDPTEGRILLNGIDLKDYCASSVRGKIATLFQEFQPYSMPIDQLIACCGETDRDKVAEVLRDVGLYDRIMRHSGGITSEYGKLFDENGVVLSGGELQKLFIARMRYKAGDMYIMDEPSSALDPVSEYEINNLILQTANEHTVIMIAHRLSTTVNADVILMMEDGRIVERGSHKELLSLQGKYANMFHLQTEQYREFDKVTAK